MWFNGQEMNENNIHDKPYNYKIDGISGEWYCVLWYNGPLIWENKDKTHLLFSGKYTSQFETYKLYKISSDEYNEMVNKLVEDKNDGKRQDKHGVDLLHDSGIMPVHYYSMHDEWENLKPFDEDALRESNPEIFI